ncbi:response regulator [Bacillus sp. FJAT-26390]|uniref:response regulator transcription factor n=1 Tax=Bacillus sp. FJAT-26390 TaxID=1743142 RepID=UPI0011469D8B|nr:response regulator [Bacillus sp. FJAT-26390]
MKVMIVDDEALAVEDLESLIEWQDYNFHIIGTARNGRRAMELFRVHKPDLVITDVRMPIVNGLELAELIRSENELCRIIMITSYQDFEYAKQAIRYGVSSYLLKHEIDAQTLLDTILSVRLQWERLISSVSMVQEEYLRKLFIGKHTEAPHHLGTDWLKQLDSPLALFYLKQDTPYPLFPELISEFGIPLSQIFKYDQFDIEMSMKHLISVPLNDREIVLIYSITNTHQLWKVQQEQINLAKHLQKIMRQSSNETISIAGSVAASGKRELNTIFHRSHALFLKRWFNGREAYYTLEDNPDIELSPNTFFPEQLQEIQEERDLLVLQEKIPGYFDHIQKLNDPLSLQLLTSELLKKLDFHRNKYGMLPTKIANEDMVHQVLQIFHVDDIKQWFISQMNLLSQQIEKDGFSNLSRKTREAIQFIHKNYNADLSVESVSTSVSISVPYLHQLFKKELQQTFLEYVTSYRVNIAKKLLQENNLKIYEIAEKIGYRNSAYFSQVFYKVTGFTPQEYRKGG